MSSDVRMGTAKPLAYNEITMGTAKAAPDVHMATAKAGLTLRQAAMKDWERELLDSAEVKRKATVAQLCEQPSTFSCSRLIDIISDFLDYYFQTLGYLASRKERRAKFDKDTATRGVKGQEYTQEFKSYCGRERVILRRRRTKLKVDQFHIIAQVGQGGYGEVYLARKQDSGEVCALKKMRKKTLHKMDEVSHIHGPSLCNTQIIYRFVMS